ncbi:MAG: CoA pyrophosphatase [Gaiellales bacterium]
MSAADRIPEALARIAAGLEPAAFAIAGVDMHVATAPDAAPRASAVALMLKPAGSGGFELLLIRRAQREGDTWSGHVALPGGRAEAFDVDIVHSAMRETMEEVGVDLNTSSSTLLGALPVLTPRIMRAPHLSVHPFVWALDGDVAVTPNEEVAEAYWVSFEALRSSDNAIEHRIMDPDGVEHTLPAVRVGKDVLWGITHRMVMMLFEAMDH